MSLHSNHNLRGPQINYPSFAGVFYLNVKKKKKFAFIMYLLLYYFLFYTQTQTHTDHVGQQSVCWLYVTIPSLHSSVFLKVLPTWERWQQLD